MIKNITSWPLFSNSVRVFFPLAAFIAVLIPMYTVVVTVNGYPFRTPHLSLFEWHGHQMIFNFLYTLVLGFILTAGAHWTKKEPIQGTALIILLVLWLAEQVALLSFENKSLLLFSSFLLSGYFLWLLTNLLWSYPKKWIFITIVGLLSICKLLFVYGASHRGFWYKDQLYEVGAGLFALLAAIIGGRVIPNFTKNFFKLSQNLGAPDLLIKTSLFATTLIIFTSFIPFKSVNIFIYFMAGISNLIKILYWKPLMAIKKPIIGMLHIGYLSLSLSFIIKGLTYFYEPLNFTKANLHLILAGGVSILALNIMLRATLGHTGRKIEMSKTIATMFMAISIGAIIRFIIPVFWPHLFIQSLHHSMGFWTLAFLIYLIKFIPIVIKPRVQS
jgi:uncharacterized protein involved in response to NO